MNLYNDQFSDKHDLTRVSQPTKILIIASTGRSGSHMLGHILHKTNYFGFPLEYVNPSNLLEWKKRFGKSTLNEVLSEIQQRRTSPNGVFGIKIHYSHIKQFGGFDRLSEMFPEAYFVHLTRKNVLKQAVSLSIAEQTGVWISGQKPTNNNPQYSFSNIDRALRNILLDSTSWKYTLEANGCNYIEMDFEHVRSNIPSSVKEIAEFMKIEINIDQIPKEQITKKQSNAINSEWEQKFLADYEEVELIKEKVSLSSRLKKFVYRQLGV